jgi:hypothetical protein
MAKGMFHYGLQSESGSSALDPIAWKLDSCRFSKVTDRHGLENSSDIGCDEQTFPFHHHDSVSTEITAFSDTNFATQKNVIQPQAARLHITI